MRVLLATDGSEDAHLALRAAVRLLELEDCHFDVLYIAPQLRRPRSKSVQQAYRDRAAAESRHILTCAKRVFIEEGANALALCETGSPANVIMRRALDYDLTVLGAKGRDERSNIGLGPVASRLVEHASGCVLIGREPPSDRSVRILVPVDGSTGSEHALDALSSMFDLESAEITLLHVIETLWLPAPSSAEGETDAEARENSQFSEELRREAEELMVEARARVLPLHPGVTTLIREGLPANEILSEADQGDYDLVAVGANACDDMKHSVLGSVSSKVAWNAPCSVLVARPPE